MTATQDATIAELQRANAELWREREAGLARETTLAEELAARDAALAQRNTQYSERIEHQAATINVLKVMSASPGEAQPVFDLIVRRATELCNGFGTALSEFDGGLVHFRASYFTEASDTAAHAAYAAAFPSAPTRGSISCRAILDREIVHVRDTDADLELSQLARELHKATFRSQISIPLMRDGQAIGAISLGGKGPGGFSDSQIEMLKTFAEQAVIAITSAETYRALQTRTADLQESLDYQTATSDVLNVISRSSFDLKPMLEKLLSIAIRLCNADDANLSQREADGLRILATRSALAEWAAALEGRLLPEDRSSVNGRAVLAGRPVQIVDAAGDVDYTLSGAVAVGHSRTCLGVPLLRDGVVIGAIGLARRRVEPFTDRQIELVRTFADQAVIAIENTRLLTEQREALEQQTATAEVLQIINASPGELGPVFEAILERAHTLCGAPLGSLVLHDGKQLRAVATRGYPHEYEALARQGFSPTPPFEMLLNGEPFVHVDDTATRPVAPNEPDPMRHSAVEIAGIHTALFVPLRKDAAVLGYISAQRQEVRPFNDKQIALLRNFAAQAVIAMENARLLTETREALEQQTATAEVLQIINASPGDLEPVFDAMLEKATLLCEAPRGQLATFDGEHFRFVAVHGDTGYSEGQFAQGATRPEIGVTWPRIVAGEQVVHLVDVADTDHYRAGHEGARRFVDVGRGRTLLTVALRKDDVILGSLTVYRQEVRPFTDKQIALLQNFAAQAVIAMENARLLTEQQEALEQQTATAEVLQVINASPGNLAPVFDAMLQKATDLCAAAFGILWTFDGEHYHANAFRNVPPAYAEFLRDPPPATPLTPLGRIAAGEAFAHIADIADEIFAAGGPLFHRAVEFGGFRTMVGVALRKDAVLLGAITIYRQEVRPFSDKQIVLLQNFAAQAVVAMENARLLDEIRQRQEELHITFENMGDGVAMFDETQHLVAWNRKFQDILDVPDDIIARRQTYSEYVRYLAERGEFGPDTEEQVRQFVEQAGRSRTYERTRPDGRVIEVRHNPVPDGGFVLIYADITERKRNEAEIRAARDAAEEASRTIEAAYRDLKAAQANLIQAEKMASLGQLTAGIAHEIKNPLNFVNNFAALSVDLLNELKETVAPGLAALSEQERAEVEDVSTLLTSNLEKITEHGKRADGIVKAMLEHSRGSSVERRMVDLNALIDEALNLAYHGARAQDQSFNTTLERDFGDGIAQIEVNPQDMTRVFLNLFGNGFYAATKRARNGEDARFEPTLKVTTRNTGDAVEIRVRDNGTGIQADIRDKLFQPFFTTKPTGEGTGLGLSITYDIVTKAHGGSIAVDSRVGDYSEFTIRLPRNL